MSTLIKITLVLVSFFAYATSHAQPFLINQEPEYEYVQQEDGDWKVFLVQKTELEIIPCPKDVKFTEDEVGLMDLGHEIKKEVIESYGFFFTKENFSEGFSKNLITIKTYKMKNGFVDIATNETITTTGASDNFLLLIFSTIVASSAVLIGLLGKSNRRLLLISFVLVVALSAANIFWKSEWILIASMLIGALIIPTFARVDSEIKAVIFVFGFLLFGISSCIAWRTVEGGEYFVGFLTILLFLIWSIASLIWKRKDRKNSTGNKESTFVDRVTTKWKNE